MRRRPSSVPAIDRPDIWAGCACLNRRRRLTQSYNQLIIDVLRGEVTMRRFAFE